MEKSCYSCWVPEYMVAGIHMIHLSGILMQPGKQNDYTIQLSGNGIDAALHWWDPAVCDLEEKLISIIKLSTGERWAWSSKEGVYVDTRKVNYEETG